MSVGQSQLVLKMRPDFLRDHAIAGFNFVRHELRLHQALQKTKITISLDFGEGIYPSKLSSIDCSGKWFSSLVMDHRTTEIFVSCNFGLKSYV